MILFRQELGEVLRERRRAQDRTLRDVAAAASVSLGYLSEMERGVKEASSELLAAVCEALDVPMSVVLDDVSRRIAVVESLSAPVTLPVGAGREPVVSASAA
ncbi:helix-turn-helix protein [Knoellia remsis]|uniref:Helix-turn-helix protein n=1 Tax=Knoellia remsis TaxID=407159 RepID=A0A2T0V0G7_9MICO|nr:helix-turn-helix transcriptional regulator [Knoellia remsis]PRY63644.1 helix-turn-helix protein [Knoellia remsis]